MCIYVWWGREVLGYSISHLRDLYLDKVVSNVANMCLKLDIYQGVSVWGVSVRGICVLGGMCPGGKCPCGK